jgi:alkaline phosphatase D
MPSDYVKQRLDLTKTAVGYSQLKRVIGVWDDHDYGANNADRTLEVKKVNRELFLDFIDEPHNTQRRL